MFDMFDDKKFVVEYNSINNGEDITKFKIIVFNTEDEAVTYIMEELKPNPNILEIHLYHNNEEIPINDECNTNSEQGNKKV